MKHNKYERFFRLEKGNHKYWIDILGLYLNGNIERKRGMYDIIKTISLSYLERMSRQIAFMLEVLDKKVSSPINYGFCVYCHVDNDYLIIPTLSNINIDSNIDFNMESFFGFEFELSNYAKYDVCLCDCCSLTFDPLDLNIRTCSILSKNLYIKRLNILNIMITHIISIKKLIVIKLRTSSNLLLRHLFHANYRPQSQGYLSAKSHFLSLL